MNIDYFEPLSRAWNRMIKALFKPFDITKWFVVGFTAFLAGLMDWPHGSNSSNSHGRGDLDLHEIVNLPYIIWDWLMNHPGWFTLIIFGLTLLIAFIILLTWLSSRGKFMFLDNVVHDRAQVIKPWNEFRTLGHSLFFWRLCFGLICLGLFFMFLVFCYFGFVGLYEDNASRYEIIWGIIKMALLGCMLIIITGYVSLFLDSFVVPIMYKQNLKTVPAWMRFMPLLRQNLLHFLLYGLLIFVLYIVIVFSVIIVGLLTCCIGILLLIIPYIGSVVTLPISYTLRAFSLEFLAQFDADLALFTDVEDSASNNHF